MTEARFISAPAAREALASIGLDATMPRIGEGVFTVAFAVPNSKTAYVVTADPAKAAVYNLYGLLHNITETVVVRPTPVVSDTERGIFDVRLHVLEVKRLTRVMRGITPSFGPLLAEIRKASKWFPAPEIVKSDHWAMNVEKELSFMWRYFRFMANPGAPVLGELAARLVDEGIAGHYLPNFGTAQVMLDSESGEIYPVGCVNSVGAICFLLNRHPFPTLAVPGDYHYGEGAPVSEDLSLWEEWMEEHSGLASFD